MKKRKLRPQDALERLLETFDKARCQSLEEAKKILRAAGLNPEKEKEKGLTEVERLLKKAKGTPPKR